MSVQRRVEKLEKTHREAVEAACRRLFAQLSDEELDALRGPSESWEQLSDGELRAVATGVRRPPPGLAEYQPPGWVLRRLWELATPEERRLLELEEVRNEQA